MSKSATDHRAEEKSRPRKANKKAWALLAKLQALAERGVDGEKTVAQIKLARLKARFDFSKADAKETGDLFIGRFHADDDAVWIYSFDAGEFDVANSVKWAIESAAHIQCLHRGSDLLAMSTPTTAKKLNIIAAGIAEKFRALINQFMTVQGVSIADRGVFLMGLYDGMMNETREVGQRLPNRAEPKKRRGPKKSAQTGAPGLHVHPYSIALGLGRQIRFSVPLTQISAELEAATRKELPA